MSVLHPVLFISGVLMVSTGLMMYSSVSQNENWASPKVVSHVARREDGRWSRRLLGWAPTKGGRRVGRPARRWEDDLSAYKQNWRELAQDRDVWAGLEDQFVKFS